MLRRTQDFYKNYGCRLRSERRYLVGQDAYGLAHLDHQHRRLPWPLGVNVPLIEVAPEIQTVG
jgi:hypothetical protein